MTNFSDVLSYIGAQATSAEIRQLFDVGNDRIKVLRKIEAAQTACAVVPGETKAKIKDIRPKYLNGLTGTVTGVENAGRGKQVATLELDANSSLTYRLASRRGGMITSLDEDRPAFVNGIPVSCLELLLPHE